MQFLHSGNSVLSDEKFYQENIYLNRSQRSSHHIWFSANMNSLARQFISGKGIYEMFRNIYRAIVISRTKSTATKAADSLSKHMLKDIGHSRSDIVRTAVESVSKELDQVDIKKAQAAFLGKPTCNLFPEFITNTSLSPVVILSSKGPRLGQRLLRGSYD